MQVTPLGWFLCSMKVTTIWLRWTDISFSLLVCYCIANWEPVDFPVKQLLYRISLASSDGILVNIDLVNGFVLSLH